MQQLVYEGPGSLTWREAKKPEIEHDHEALVRPVVATACDVDQAIVRGQSPFQGPFPIGHECVGRVEQVGDLVSEVRPGDLVAVPYHRSCGECGPCRAQLPLHCERSREAMPPAYGLPHVADWGGMFSDAIRVPFANHALLRLPDGVDPIAAVSVGDNLSDAFSTTVPHLRKRPGASVLVTGQGGYGLYAIQWARAAGAGDLCYVDDDATRLERAESLGARVLPWHPGLRTRARFDLIVNARPGVEILDFALRSAAPEAVCENVVIYFESIALPLGAMHARGVHLHSTFCHARCFMPAVLDELARGTIDPRAVESEVIDWQDAPRALSDPSHKPVFVRDLDGRATTPAKRRDG